ncbi:hypothetical protein [Nocardioides sp. CER19]|nr:hypothetical protein [Nocardioides sp. CER19]MDH2413771.1 hypothetical protein [Nocardioides sp. CER19]
MTDMGVSAGIALLYVRVKVVLLALAVAVGLLIASPLLLRTGSTR